MDADMGMIDTLPLVNRGYGVCRREICIEVHVLAADKTKNHE